MSDTSQKKCFVIMPFRVREHDLQRYSGDKNHWSEVYKGLICPAISKAGLIFERDDEDSTSRLITENIWRKIEAADIILCDLSAGNPNVYLELGWALRADKRFVLIKDSLTERHFDLNQHYQYEYSFGLQPTTLETDISKLAGVITETLTDVRKQYSIVSKLALQLGTIEAVQKGNVEIKMLEEILSEVRSNSRLTSNYRFLKPMTTQEIFSRPIKGHMGEIKSQEDLARELIGTVWIKKNEYELVLFDELPKCYYQNKTEGGWKILNYALEETLGHIRISWGKFGVISECVFSNGNTEFLETDNPKDCVWSLQPSKIITG